MYLSLLNYLGDGRRAVAENYLQFSNYRITCEEEHFTYPLLHSGNPVKLCDISNTFRPGICIWVGVYRQRLDMDNLNKAGKRPWHVQDSMMSLTRKTLQFLKWLSSTSTNVIVKGLLAIAKYRFFCYCVDILCHVLIFKANKNKIQFKKCDKVTITNYNIINFQYAFFSKSDVLPRPVTSYNTLGYYICTLQIVSWWILIVILSLTLKTPIQ